MGLLVPWALVALGLAWAPFFPIIKKIWSSSFVLVAGGCSVMLLALAHWLVDVKGFRKLAFPLTVSAPWPVLSNKSISLPTTWVSELLLVRKSGLGVAGL